MSIDFTVIQPVRQRFGDGNLEGDFPLEQEAPFVGRSKDFPFPCPKVDSSQMAVLQFESLSVTAGRVIFFVSENLKRRNIIQINSVNIPGGITPGATRNLGGGREEHFWKTHSLIVPANVLKQENVLHIESVEVAISGGTTLDNFIIDNVVVFFKTRARDTTTVFN
jgi:hypothetical protein